VIPRHPLLQPLLRRLLLICLMIVTQSGCAIVRQDEVVDRSFVTGQPCSSPCWYGLVVGKSPEQEITKTLELLPFVEPGRLYAWHATYPESPNALDVQFYCKGQSDIPCGVATAAEGHLQALTLVPQYRLTLREAVQQLGPPDYVTYRTTEGASSGCSVRLYWRNRQVWIESTNTRTNHACSALKKGMKLAPSDQITSIVYGAAGIFPYSASTSEQSTSWPGFADD
jgi:hypothetical protein